VERDGTGGLVGGGGRVGDRQRLYATSRSRLARCPRLSTSSLPQLVHVGGLREWNQSSSDVEERSRRRAGVGVSLSQGFTSHSTQ